MKNLGLIKFNKMTREQQIALGHWFSNNKNLKLFAPGEYTVEINNETYQFEIDTSIIRRPRASNPKEDRFEIIGPQIGKGAFGEVYKVLGTLAPHYDHSVKFKNRTRRVIKVQRHDEKNTLDSLFREFEITKAIKDLHIKEPVVVDNVSFTVMHEAVGDDLFKIILKEADEEIFLSIEERFAITIETLYAIQRLHDFGVIHNDLKLENAKFDRVSHQAKLFDFGLSKFKHENIKGNDGTIVFMSPEQLFREPTTEKSDTYSAALMLAPIWGGVNMRELLLGTPRDEALAIIFKNIKNPQLNFTAPFYKSLALSHAIKLKLENIFQEMTAYKGSKRKSIPEAIAALESLRFEYRLEKVKTSDRALIDLAHNKGRELRDALNKKNNAERSLDKNNNNDLPKPKDIIADLQKKINEYLSIISTHERNHSAIAQRIAYLEFSEMTRIKAFKNLDSKMAIQEKMSMIVNTLHAQVLSLATIVDELEEFNMSTDFSPEIDRRAINFLIKKINDVMGKDEKYGYTLDGLESLNERYRELIKALSVNPLLIKVREALQNPGEDRKKFAYAREEMRYALALFVANFLPDVADKEAYARENYKELTAARVLNSKRNTLSPVERQEVADLLTIIDDAENIKSLFDGIEVKLKTFQRGFFGRSKLEDAMISSIKDIKKIIKESARPKPGK